jgi:hypothetical protein
VDKKNVMGYVTLVFRYQLISVTYNNWAWLYRKKGKLDSALKWLHQAFKADKDLLKLFELISEIKANRRFDTFTTSKDLNELKLTDSNRNDMASTYLNICAILSVMKNHERAYHNAQKAIEIITNQDKMYEFNLDSFAQNIENDVRITLAASYYNKTVELDYLSGQNRGGREYRKLAYDSIQCAMQVWKYLPEEMDLPLVKEIKWMYEKLQISGQVRLPSRGSSKRSQRRVFSPPMYNRIKEVQFPYSPPSSVDQYISPIYKTKDMVMVSPLIGKRKHMEIDNKGDRSDLGISSFSQYNNSEDGKDDSGSIRYNSRGSGNNNIYVAKPPTNVVNMRNFYTNHQLPLVSQQKDTSKTSFEVQPISPKNQETQSISTFKNERMSIVPDRHYQLDNPEFSKDYVIRKNRDSRVFNKSSNRISWLRF